MNNRNTLKNQIFASIGIAVLIIICSAIYLFTSLTKFSNNNRDISTRVQQQLEASSNLNFALFKLTDNKISDIVLEKNESNTDYIFIYQIPKNLATLKELARSTNTLHGEFIELAQSILKQINNTSTFNSKVEYLNYFLTEQEKIAFTYNTYISHIIADRNIQLNSNENDFNNIKYTTLILISLCLSVIIYAIYKFYLAINNLENTTADLQKLNYEFENATYKIESTNWILELNTLVTDNIRGLDDTQKIGEILLLTLNENLPLQAGTIYVRKPNTEIFELFDQIGLQEENILKNFIASEGYLGKVVADKEMVIQQFQIVEHLQTSSTLINKFPTTVFLCPLVHDNISLGLLEVAIYIEKKEELKKYQDFFIRLSHTIAGKIKFGQSHILVEQLLQETKRQKEEMEYQQEELRITNEELIYKTNLLETSEEELSVQQEELSQTNIELTKKAIELEKRNTELNTTQKIVEQKITEVEQASKYKSEFMANMSHELRTPLNSILILAKLLQDNKTENLTTEQIKFASIIHSSGSDLLALINELLDLAKIESGKIVVNLEKINTIAFSKHIHEIFNALAKEKNITFITEVPKDTTVEFVSDEYRLQQIIKNFLSNAFKFTNKGGQVTLIIKEIEDNLYFSVSDNGIGISKEKQDLIFEAFTQEDGSTSRKYGGTGLGLSISREIASLLRGRITLDSTVGKGSTFTLIIPKEIVLESNRQTKQKKEKIQRTIQPNTTVRKSKRILIIEDDINFADILQGFAQEHGYTTTIVHDGATGIEKAKEMIPDAIILDVMLPGYDGWTVLKTLKDDISTHHIPIHMMSAANFNRKDFIDQGAIGFLKKPISEQSIQETFQNINLNLNQSVKKILLIEDQEYQSDSIKKSFSKQNINIIQAFTLQSALEKLEIEKNIDCIILDIKLPDGTGLDLIEKTKEKPHLASIPIIINTAGDLPKEQYEKILNETQLTIIKSEKSTERLIDEVNLFLNKITTEDKLPFENKIVPNKTNSLKGKRVLIADDDMRNIFALTTSLQSFNMEIEIANNGKEAVQILKENDKIDIILMDIMMPEMNGYEAIKYIREELKLTKLPIIAVTAKAMKGDREKSIQVGASDYVSKPIDIDKLISLMHVWLS